MNGYNLNRIRVFIVAVILTILIPSATIASDAVSKIRLNPEIKVKRISNGSVIVTSRNPDETSLKHEFKDFYADLILGVYRKQSLELIFETLRKKYYLSEDECRRELKHALNTLSEWKIILREDYSL